MQKLIEQYQTAKTLANAKRIFNHIKKHPFSYLAVDQYDHAVIQAALMQIEAES
jgi:hypothetical protein